MIVRAKPLSKLCEFGMPLPEDYKSDCYDDVDETDYACKEKSRIMVSVCVGWKSRNAFFAHLTMQTSWASDSEERSLWKQNTRTHGK